MAVHMYLTLFSCMCVAGDCFLKMRKPVAAIRDAKKALEMNPDSAKAHKTKSVSLPSVHRLYTGFFFKVFAMYCNLREQYCI